MNSMKLVIPLHSLYWSILTKDESKRGTAFAFIFGVNLLWHCCVMASFRVFFSMRYDVTEWQISGNDDDYDLNFMRFLLFVSKKYVQLSIVMSQHCLALFSEKQTSKPQEAQAPILFHSDIKEILKELISLKWHPSFFLTPGNFMLLLVC